MWETARISVRLCRKRSLSSLLRCGITASQGQRHHRFADILRKLTGINEVHGSMPLFQVPPLVSPLRICHAFRRRTRDALRHGPGNSQRCSCFGPFIAKHHRLHHFGPFHADLRPKSHCFLFWKRCIFVTFQRGCYMNKIPGCWMPMIVWPARMGGQMRPSSAARCSLGVGLAFRWPASPTKNVLGND